MTGTVWFFLIATAVGHVALFVGLVNVLHGLGLDNRPRSRLLQGVLFVAVAVGGAWAWHAWHSPSWPDWPWPIRVQAGLAVAAALVLVPAPAIREALRRHPEGVTERNPASTVDLAEEHGRDALIGEGSYGWMLRLPGNESLRLVRRDWELSLPGLQTALDGLEILHLSDLHLSTCYDRRFFDAVFDHACRDVVDLVLFTGDLIDDPEALPWVVPLLSRLRGRLGQFAILGNHDYRMGSRAVRRAIRDSGFSDIEGRWARVEAGGLTISIGGSSYPWGRLPRGLEPAADFRLFLSHSPDMFPGLARRGADLVLAGHNHGGQIRLPALGPILMPSRYGRAFDRGFFRRGSSLMYVHEGIAAETPLRYGCPPEIARLTLRPLAVDPGPKAVAHPLFRGVRPPSRQI